MEYLFDLRSNSIPALDFPEFVEAVQRFPADRGILHRLKRKCFVVILQN